MIENIIYFIITQGSEELFAVDPMMTRSSPSDISVRTSSGLVVESSQGSIGADGSSREREDEDPEVMKIFYILI